mmetsp:Transcript_34284/g.80132  ORF Transcript_34284/g.80132 Transcript_34284/m.80132 type:complete len:249 (+) Transcript_34284:1764-2510(+)
MAPSGALQRLRKGAAVAQARCRAIDQPRAGHDRQEDRTHKEVDHARHVLASLLLWGLALILLAGLLCRREHRDAAVLVAWHSRLVRLEQLNHLLVVGLHKLLVRVVGERVERAADNHQLARSVAFPLEPPKRQREHAGLLVEELAHPRQHASVPVVHAKQEARDDGGAFLPLLPSLNCRAASEAQEAVVLDQSYLTREGLAGHPFLQATWKDRHLGAFRQSLGHGLPRCAHHVGHHGHVAHGWEPAAR